MKIYMLRTECEESGDFEQAHATKESAYCAAAASLRDAWAGQFNGPCPIIYNSNIKRFYESVSKTIEMWEDFRRDEEAAIWKPIRKVDHTLTKWSPETYSITEVDLENQYLPEYRKSWAKEDA